MIRDDQQRVLLFDLDRTIQSITATTTPDNADLLRLTGIYHNLVRRWAEV